jgi:hypothetical protein
MMIALHRRLRLRVRGDNYESNCLSGLAVTFVGAALLTCLVGTARGEDRDVLIEPVLRVNEQPLVEQGAVGGIIPDTKIDFVPELRGPIIIGRAQGRAETSSKQLQEPPSQRDVLVDIVDDVEVAKLNLVAARHEPLPLLLTVEQLDEWLFDGPIEKAEKKYRDQVNLEIAQIVTACDASAEQKRLLEFAAAGDLQEILDGRLELQSRYVGYSYPWNQRNVLLDEVSVLRNQFKVLLGRSSFDAKSSVYRLHSTIFSPSQVEKFVELIRARKLYMIRNRIDVSIAKIEQEVPLRDSQREALAQLLEIRLPNGYENGGPSWIISQLQFVAPEVFMGFLSGVQWKTLKSVYLPQYDEIWKDELPLPNIRQQVMQGTYRPGHSLRRRPDRSRGTL